MIHDGHTILFRTGHFLEFMERHSPVTVIYETFGKRIKPMLNNELIIDIDTARDLKLAELLIKERR